MLPRLATIALLLLPLRCDAQQAFADTSDLRTACRQAAGLKIGRDGVNRQQAEFLAGTYFKIYFGLCGGPVDPTRLDRTGWSIPIAVGYGGAREGAISVDRTTGSVS